MSKTTYPIEIKLETITATKATPSADWEIQHLGKRLCELHSSTKQRDAEVAVSRLLAFREKIYNSGFENGRADVENTVHYVGGLIFGGKQ